MRMVEKKCFRFVRSEILTAGENCPFRGREVKKGVFVDEKTTHDVVDQVLAPREGIVLCEVRREVESISHRVGHVC